MSPNPLYAFRNMASNVGRSNMRNKVNPGSIEAPGVPGKKRKGPRAPTRSPHKDLGLPPLYRHGI